MPISASLMMRASFALSSLSASSPASPENRKKGVMNTAPAMAMSWPESQPCAAASR